MIPFRHIWRALRHGVWESGFATREEWPGKPYFAIVSAYYDGQNWDAHLGTFYISVSY